MIDQSHLCSSLASAIGSLIRSTDVSEYEDVHSSDTASNASPVNLFFLAQGLFDFKDPSFTPAKISPDVAEEFFATVIRIVDYDQHIDFL